MPEAFTVSTLSATVIVFCLGFASMSRSPGGTSGSVGIGIMYFGATLILGVGGFLSMIPEVFSTTTVGMCMIIAGTLSPVCWLGVVAVENISLPHRIYRFLSNTLFLLPAIGFLTMILGAGINIYSSL